MLSVNHRASYRLGLDPMEFVGLFRKAKGVRTLNDRFSPLKRSTKKIVRAGSLLDGGDSFWKEDSAGTVGPTASALGCLRVLDFGLQTFAQIRTRDRLDNRLVVHSVDKRPGQ